MKIFITTKGRTDNQITWRYLPDTLKAITWFVCPHSEESWFSKMTHNVISVPDHYRLPDSRQEVLMNAENTGNKVALLDDDLRFYTRVNPEEPLAYPLRKCEGNELFDGFMELGTLLDTYAHVAMSAREGNNRLISPYSYNTRTLRVLAYRQDIFQAEGLDFRDMLLMSDFHITLSLLELGYQNCVMANWAQDQPGSNTEGGCSEYRTLELLAEHAHKLKSLHPDFVTVGEKETKGAWGGGKRTDVTIRWKKALGTKASLRKFQP